MAMASGEMATSLIEGLLDRFDNQEDCDVEFAVEGKIIGAHKVVLAVRSSVLRDLASEWHRGKDPIPIETMTYQSFEAMLRFLYSGEIPVGNKNIFIFLSAAVLYKILHLEKICVDHIAKLMNKENMCFFMNEAVNFGSTLLQEKCCEMFQKETLNILQSFSSFVKLSQPALSALLDVEESNVIEIIIFHLIKKWMYHQCVDRGLAPTGENMRKVLGDAFYKIRFPTMTVQDFANSVTTIDNFLTDSETTQIFKKITVFNKNNVNCPFSDKFRCQVPRVYMSFKDLFESKVLHRIDRDEMFDFMSMAEHVTTLPNGHRMFYSSFRLLLQCCADMANSSDLICQTTAGNRSTRNELSEHIRNWKCTANTENVHNIMTQYMEMRALLDKLHNWSL